MQCCTAEYTATDRLQQSKGRDGPAGIHSSYAPRLLARELSEGLRSVDGDVGAGCSRQAAPRHVCPLRSRRVAGVSQRLRQLRQGLLDHARPPERYARCAHEQNRTDALTLPQPSTSSTSSTPRPTAPPCRPPWPRETPPSPRAWAQRPLRAAPNAARPASRPPGNAPASRSTCTASGTRATSTPRTTCRVSSRRSGSWPARRPRATSSTPWASTPSPSTRCAACPLPTPDRPQR